MFATVNGVAQVKSVQLVVQAPKLKVTAIPGTITQNSNVTFTATITPTPTTTWYPNWTWTSVGGGGLSAACQWNHNPCTRIVSKSGWMKVTTTYDGYSLVDSARVYKVPCPTGDSLVDSETMRKALMDVIDNSNANASNELERTERAALLLRDRVTQELIVFYWPTPGTNCKIGTPDFEIDFTKYTLEASMHSHTYSVLEAHSQCKELDGTITSWPGLSTPGTSDYDDIYLKGLNDWLQARGQPKVDEYIVARDFIYRAFGNQAGRSITISKWSQCPNFRI